MAWSLLQIWCIFNKVSSHGGLNTFRVLKWHSIFCLLVLLKKIVARNAWMGEFLLGVPFFMMICSFVFIALLISSWSKHLLWFYFSTIALYHNWYELIKPPNAMMRYGKKQEIQNNANLLWQSCITAHMLCVDVSLPPWTWKKVKCKQGYNN